METLRPFPGMKHLDVAGGTGDVAFRILKAVRQAEIEGRARTGLSNTSLKTPPGSVVVCDINPQVREIQGYQFDDEVCQTNEPFLHPLEPGFVIIYN